MHAVIPEIQLISEEQDISLARVNKFSITNTGSATIQLGFTDNMVELSSGSATSFESGANAWFADDVNLKIRFKTSSGSTVKQCTVMLCRISKPSNIFADALK